MKKFLVVFGSLMLFTACSHDLPSEVVEEVSIPSPVQEVTDASNCSGEVPICEGPSCGDLNCANCENESCENKTNPGAGCGCGKNETKNTSEESAETVVRTISIDAQRFEFSPNVIRIKKGETVEIKVNNIDTTHNISIPQFNIKDQQEALFTATESGEFEFYCANMCGGGHGGMVGKIIIEE